MNLSEKPRNRARVKEIAEVPIPKLLKTLPMVSRVCLSACGTCSGIWNSRDSVGGRIWPLRETKKYSTIWLRSNLSFVWPVEIMSGSVKSIWMWSLLGD